MLRSQSFFKNQQQKYDYLEEDPLVGSNFSGVETRSSDNVFLHNALFAKEAKVSKEFLVFLRKALESKEMETIGEIVPIRGNLSRLSHVAGYVKVKPPALDFPIFIVARSGNAKCFREDNANLFTLTHKRKRDDVNNKKFGDERSIEELYKKISSENFSETDLKKISESLTKNSKEDLLLCALDEAFKATAKEMNVCINADAGVSRFRYVSDHGEVLQQSKKKWGLKTQGFIRNIDISTSNASYLKSFTEQKQRILGFCGEKQKGVRICAEDKIAVELLKLKGISGSHIIDGGYVMLSGNVEKERDVKRFPIYYSAHSSEKKVATDEIVIIPSPENLQEFQNNNNPERLGVKVVCSCDFCYNITKFIYEGEGSSEKTNPISTSPRRARGGSTPESNANQPACEWDQEFNGIIDELQSTNGANSFICDIQFCYSCLDLKDLYPQPSLNHIEFLRQRVTDIEKKFEDRSFSDTTNTNVSKIIVKAKEDLMAISEVVSSVNFKNIKMGY